MSPIAAAVVVVADVNEGSKIVSSRYHSDEDGEFNDPNLEENAPMVYAYVKILFEVYDLTDVAFQRMKGQKFHCDPPARLADSDEKHCLLTLDGPHALAFSTSV